MRHLATHLIGQRVLFVLLLSVMLLGACQERTVLSLDATVPPEFLISSFIDVPDSVGTAPTPFDGKWEGYLIVDNKKCLPIVLQTYFRLTFDISEGLIRRINYINSSGFINKHGVYIARVYLGDYTFSGKISGDRLSGKWNSWGVLCGGRNELIRSTGDQHYCIDRLNGKPYASPLECRGIDKLLTKAEFQALQTSPERK